MKFINLTLFISRFGVHRRENIIFMGIFFDHSKQTEVSCYKLQQMYGSRRGVSNYSKCTRSASVSNSDSKCMRFSYLLELCGLSACGPTLEIFERSRLDLLKSGSLIRAFDVFAIAFRIYPKGPLIIHISPCFFGFRSVSYIYC